MRVDKLLDILVAELEADSKLPNSDPHKRSVEQRDVLIRKLISLKVARKTNDKTTKNGVSRNGIKMGRPRRDLNPESQGKTFLRTLEKVVGKDERQESEVPGEGQSEESVA